MFYFSLLITGAVLVTVLVLAKMALTPPKSPRELEDRTRELEARLTIYEDALLKIAADDSGHPQLDAKIAITEARNKFTY